MEKRVELNLLNDFYGPLLTPRRHDLVRMYCEEDLSLSEIADEWGVTRQGVYDALRHATRQLERYESRLKLLARYLAVEREITTCRELLLRVAPQPGSERALDDARRALDRIELTQA